MDKLREQSYSSREIMQIASRNRMHIMKKMLKRIDRSKWERLLDINHSSDNSETENDSTSDSGNSKTSKRIEAEATRNVNEIRPVYEYFTMKDYEN